ncbi:MAG: OmcA/MtrC family decaheme c-type cytochrome [Xanthomonadales bacterium]|nr:OmcA/MtrC family decaheme c-type cytochrome [Xanthomonadales bacterium]
MTYRPGYGLITMLVLSLCTSPMALAKSEAVADYGFTSADKEAYLTEAEIAFVRPGLELEIMDVVIPADRMAEVTFKISDPAGLPLDKDGVYTPGPVSTSFILSFIPAGEKAYVAYTTRVATSPETGDSAIQASSDSGGTYTMVEDGVYTYKFATVLPEDYDSNATHTLGIYARRDLREWDLDRYVVNELDHFIPSGTGVATPRDMVTTETCNSCHDPLAIHGGARTEVGLCVLCHNPTQSIDPDTGDSVDMGYMVHKIHAGAHLENGYTIIGYRQSVHDYSNVEFTTDLNDCEVCHTGGTPTDEMPLVLDPNPSPACNADGLAMTEAMWGDKGQVEIRINAPDGPLFAASGGSNAKTTGNWVRDNTVFFMVDANTGEVLQEVPASNTVFGCANNPPGASNGVAASDHSVWMTNPSMVACGSCHDDIDFEAGVNHPVQSDDSGCSFCHQPTGDEYGFSVAGSHTVDYQSTQLGGFLVDLVDITNTGPGEKPTVVFSMKNKWGPLLPAHLNRLRVSISGPNEDFSFYVQESPLDDIKRAGENWSYQFKTPLPDDATGSFSVGFEGRLNAVINEGKPNEFGMTDQMQNFIAPFAVTDTAPMSRRMVVDDAKCESCHSNLSLHGSNRHDANGYCQSCHMPSLTDAAVRPEGNGEPESVDFRYMIHKIHRGAELENGYVVYGYRSSVHDYSHVEYVGDLRNCEACHVDDSYTLPLPDGTLPVTTPRDLWTPMLPETASCLSCHDSEGAAIHADANTSDLGETCSTCHGTGKPYSVEALHAR